MLSTPSQLIERRRGCPVPGVVAIFVASWLAIGSAILGQSPAGPRVAVVTGDAAPRDIFVRPDGGTLLSWIQSSSQSFISFECFALGLSELNDEPDGNLITLLRVPRTSRGTSGCPRMAGNASGNLVFIYGFGRPYAIRTGFADGPRKVELNSNPKHYPRHAFDLAMDDRGDFFVLWDSLVDRRTGAEGLFGRLVDAQGKPVGPDVHVNTIPLRNLMAATVSMSPETGQFVVVWASNPVVSGVQVAGQLFAPDGTRIGTEFRVGSFVEGNWHPSPVVTMRRDGSFVIVWQEPNPPPQASMISLLGQRFGPTGSPVGSQFLVTEDLFFGSFVPQVASDPGGNFVIAWSEEATGKVTARLYHADGTPAGPPRWLMGRGVPLLSFGFNGTFAIAWTETNDLVGTIVYERRFAASPGQEICAYSKSPFEPIGVFVCLTGRSNTSDTSPAIHHPFGGQPGDIGLLGDIDGDGRADPCVFRNGVFLCDTNHDYGTTGVVVPFGQAGDIPFLGDVDGDGRADPCVYRSGHFLCDTGHQGGAPAIDIAFGAPGDIPLLGDVDGDGRADPCVYRSGLFLCDTRHTGTADVQSQFGQAGDFPVLGDFDNDGRADPCVVRNAELLCDTAHDGQVGGTVHLWLAGLAPLFGNIDGL
jgi:hypothetical protein